MAAVETLVKRNIIESLEDFLRIYPTYFCPLCPTTCTFQDLNLAYDRVVQLVVIVLVGPKS